MGVGVHFDMRSDIFKPISTSERTHHPHQIKVALMPITFFLKRIGISITICMKSQTIFIFSFGTRSSSEMKRALYNIRKGSLSLNMPMHPLYYIQIKENKYKRL